MDKKKLLALIAKKEARKAELNTKANVSEDVAELRSINTELEGLNGEITELRAMADAIPDEAPLTGSEQRGAPLQPQGGFQPLGTYQGVPQVEKRAFDKVLDMPANSEAEKTEMRAALFATPEYRSAFLKNLQSKPLDDAEKRALSLATGTGGAVVPSITYDMIIKRLVQVSALFGRIRKTFIPANVVLPVANPQIAALWTDSAPAGLLTGTASDDTVAGVSLSSYALSKFAAVKIQLLLMSIDAFEAYIVQAISDQLGVAIENAIINGTGSGSSQPTGILPGVTWDATNSATWAHNANVGYDDLVGARSLLKLYRQGALWVMNQNMEAMVYKIKSTTAQPLFTLNPITGQVNNPMPLGMEIVVDYYVPDNTILLINPDYYYMNITQSPEILTDNSVGFMSTSRIYRGTLFADAKPALSEAFVKLTMATS
jgi:HK97 family phage major capsid protein